MKKLFIILVISSIGFAACNNGAENKESADSLTVAPMDTASVGTSPVDTMVNLDTASNPSLDTIVHH